MGLYLGLFLADIWDLHLWAYIWALFETFIRLNLMPCGNQPIDAVCGFSFLFFFILFII